MLKPRPGCCVVKMRPISRFVESDIAGPNGEKIFKPDETIQREEVTNNWATVARVNWRDDELQWFKEGDSVLITRLGGTRFEISDDWNIHPFWLLPNECVQGVDE